MKKPVQSAWMVGALVAFLSIGMALSAQDTTPSQSTDQQAQQPATPPPSQSPATQDQPPAPSSPQPGQPSSQMDQSAPPAQAQPPAQPPQTPPETTPDSSGQRPDAQSESTPTSAAQSFTGTIVKAGDKYRFQDAATGNTYDIDHQDEVSKYEGKKVKVHGTLDGKTIHLQ
jgi:DNA mismatch repair ATPase MutL